MKKSGGSNETRTRDISPTTACTGRYLNRLEEKKDQPHVQLEATYHRYMKRRWYHINLKTGMTVKFIGCCINEIYKDL